MKKLKAESLDDEVLTVGPYKGCRRGSLRWPESRRGFYSEGLHQVLSWVTTVRNARDDFLGGLGFLRGVSEQYAQDVTRLVRDRIKMETNEDKRIFYQYLNENMPNILTGVLAR